MHEIINDSTLYGGNSHQTITTSELNTVRATIVVPVYNEEAALPQVLEAIFAVVDSTYEVLVVDDGSSDNTRMIAMQYPCRVISHPFNKGKGAAMKTGIISARSEKVVFIDGDATYPADAIPRVVSLLDQYDLVRCVRSEGRDNIPLLNRIGNQFFDTLISFVHSVEGGDILSGLYGVCRRHLLTMRLESNGFDIETEIMVKAQAMQLVLYTFPIQYFERVGDKKLNPTRDGIKIFMRILRLASLLNPFLAYILPGLVIWLIGCTISLFLAIAPRSMLSLSTGMYILATVTMTFLAGSTLLIIGSVVSIYAGEVGLRNVSSVRKMLVIRDFRRAMVLGSLVMICVGILGICTLFVFWVLEGFGGFSYIDQLLVLTWLIICGVQLLSMTIFLSLFVRSFKEHNRNNYESVHLEPVQYSNTHG